MPRGRLSAGIEPGEVDEDDVGPSASKRAKVAVEAGPAEDGESGRLGPDASGDQEGPDPLQPGDISGGAGLGCRLGFAEDDDPGAFGLAAVAPRETDDVTLVLGPAGRVADNC